jgi:hypothetical protein
MESNKLIFLKVDLEAQMNDIERIHQKLLDRVAKLQVDDEVILESIAYQIHNLYCATEDLLKIVVIEKHFTLSRADGSMDSTFSMEPEEMR